MENSNPTVATEGRKWQAYRGPRYGMLAVAQHDHAKATCLGLGHDPAIYGDRVYCKRCGARA